MSGTLPLVNRLLSIGKAHVDAGRYAYALPVLSRVAHLEGLPAAVMEESHVLIADAQRHLGALHKARRHLHVALALNPENAELHDRMAAILDEDGEKPVRARWHHRRATELAPQDAGFTFAYGQSLLAAGGRTQGKARRLLARALELDPDNLEYLQAMALAMVEAGRGTAARRLVLRERFRHGSNAEYRKVLTEVCFHITRHEQVEMKAAAKAIPGRATVLPFRRLVRAAKPKEEPGTILRFDGPSTAKPHLPRPVRSWRNQ